MKKILFTAMLAAGMLAACNQKVCNNQNTENMNTTLTLTQEWDKVFPKSDKVDHQKVTFETQYGLLTSSLSAPSNSAR